MEREKILGRGKSFLQKSAAKAKQVSDASVNIAQSYGPKAVGATAKLGGNIAKSKGAQRIATGAAAGAAIGAALPFVPIATGAILGAGVLVMFKAMKDQD